MTELKTLEDLEAENSNKKPEETMWICSVRLKQEAINHIKKDLDIIKDETKRLRKTNTLTESGFKEECKEHLREEYARIEWIKYFFNITDEDLK